MKSKFLIAPAIFTFAASFAFAQGQQPKKFDEADSNKDGILSVQEARTSLPGLQIEAGGDAEAMLTREAVKKAMPQISFGQGNERGPITEEEYDKIAQQLQQSSSSQQSSSASSQQPSSSQPPSAQASSSSSSSSQPPSQQRTQSSQQPSSSSQASQTPPPSASGSAASSQSSQQQQQQRQQSSSSSQMEPVKIKEFSEADSNKDGQLSVLEARAAVPGLQLPASAASTPGAGSSANADAMVTRAQVKQALPQISFESGSERGPITQQEFDKIVQQLEQQSSSSSSSQQPPQQRPGQ